MPALRAAETARIDGARYVPRFIISLCRCVPNDSAPQSGRLVFFQGERNRVNLVAGRTFRAPFLLIARAERRVLDVARFKVHDRSLRRVVNLGAAYLFKPRDARDSVPINFLPLREPYLVIDFVSDRLRLLA